MSDRDFIVLLGRLNSTDNLVGRYLDYGAQQDDYRLSSDESFRSPSGILGVVITSACIWICVGYLNATLMAATSFTTGIELIYLPAGFRLLIILIFGFWGAVGIFLSNPILFINVFGAAPLTEIIINSAVSAFVPLLAINLCARFCGIDPSLSRLRAIHLPILALAVSVATPLMFNLQFTASGREPIDTMIMNLGAMSLGDFLGCFLVVAFARLLIFLYRAAT